MPVPRWVIPWVLVLLALPIAALGLEATANSACIGNGAFTKGVTTEATTTLDVLASTCKITDNSDGSVFQKTIINWAGIVFALSVVIGAWLLGATFARWVSWRKAALGILVVSAATVVAWAGYFN